MRDDDWPPSDRESDELDAVQPAGSVPERPALGLRYFEMYRFIFESPRWGTNLLAGAVCQLVPVVGILVFLGYCYEVVESLHLRGGRRYPDFDTGRLMPYLTRGLGVLLVSLIFAVPMVLILACAALCMAIAFSATNEPAVLIPVGVVVFLIALVLVLATQFIGSAVTLRVGLSQELELSGAVHFAREFLRRIWKELLLGWLFLNVTGLCLDVVGLLACYVGLYPVVALIFLANFHMQFQLYQIYLARGGVPILLK